MSFAKDMNIQDCYSDEINALIVLVQHISLSFEVKEPREFFCGRHFLLSEAYENLSDSYALIKLGYYKHAYAGLRFAHDCALYSIYYSDYSKDFKQYLSSKIDSPKFDQKFWKKIISMNDLLKRYHEKRQPLNKIVNPKELHNYIHSKGAFYSYAGFMTRLTRNPKPIDAQETYNLWHKEFLAVVKVICILHLLRFPILAHVFPDSFLRLKFGTSGKYPLFGGLYGDQSDLLLKVIPESELRYIRALASKDTHCIGLIARLNSLPDLPNSILEDFDNRSKALLDRLIAGERIELTHSDYCDLL